MKLTRDWTQKPRGAVPVWIGMGHKSHTALYLCGCVDRHGTQKSDRHGTQKPDRHGTQKPHGTVPVWIGMRHKSQIAMRQNSNGTVPLWICG